MRKVAYLTFVAGLLCLPTSVWAQNDDPFRGSDPFGASDPFAADPARTKVDARKKVAQPQRVKAQATVRATPHDASYTTVRIRATLGNLTSQSFIELPLADAVQQLAETHDIPIVIDQRALEEIGLSSEEPISLSLKQVSLRSFLRLMLRELDLTYMVADEVMQITTIEAAEQNLVVEMYKISEELTQHADTIVSALTKSVVPDAWETLGGPCSVTNVENVLIVSATESIHEDVRAFLEKLRQAFADTDSAR